MVKLIYLGMLVIFDDHIIPIIKPQEQKNEHPTTLGISSLLVLAFHHFSIL